MIVFKAFQRLRIVLALSILALGFLGCSLSDAAECTTDNDCGESQRCLRGGGLLVLDGFCVDAESLQEGNVCTGEALLDGQSVEIGQSCGVCSDGEVGCSASGQYECLGATAPNVCGGCETLEENLGGECDAGKVWSCAGPDALICCPVDAEDCEDSLGEPPARPSNLEIQERHDSILLGWNPVQGAQFYQVRIDEGEWENVGSESSTTRIFDESIGFNVELSVESGSSMALTQRISPRRGAEMSFEIRAVNESGPGPASLAVLGALNSAETSLTVRWAALRPGSSELNNYLVTSQLPDGVSRISEGFVFEEDGANYFQFHIQYQGARGAQEDIFPGGVAIPLDNCPFTPMDFDDEAEQLEENLAFIERLQICEGQCVLVDQDNQNCGACGSVCGTMSCTGGMCADVVDLQSGGLVSCALLSDHSLWCWGINTFGQIGDGNFSPRWTPARVELDQDVIAMSVGYEHVCAVVADGTLRCWGSNGNQRLGLNSSESRFNTPQVVPDLVDLVSVAAGETHTCATDDNGVSYCWGSSTFGKLGHSQSSTPAAVTVLSDSVEVMAGKGHYTCATMPDETIRCWGQNSSGILGNNSVVDSATPVQPDTHQLSTVDQISLGKRHICVVAPPNSRVLCWGDNTDGQVYSQDTNLVTNRPSHVWLGTVEASEVVAGDYHSCAILSSGPAAGQVRCWGKNNMGQLGNESNAYASEPVTVVGISDARRISAGLDFSCVQEGDSRIYCWGSNVEGSLGSGSTDQPLIRQSVLWSPWSQE